MTASQVNFVLHLGFRTGPEDALAQFRTAVRFSQRYPSRVVVLCPCLSDTGVTEIRAKVYGECFLGHNSGEARCCEFVILTYPRSQRRFLENQVSVCLSPDLPLYYYAHAFAQSAALADYRYLMTRSRRVLIDSANAPEGALSYPWPRPEAVRDLAFARLVRVRQSIAQFLSRYPAPRLAEGLRAATVAHGGGCAAEGRVLLDWIRDRLGACGAAGASYRLEAPAGLPSWGLSVRFDYGKAASRFSWRGDLERGCASIEADFGAGRTALEAAVSLPSPEETLGEAMFR